MHQHLPGSPHLTARESWLRLSARGTCPPGTALDLEDHLLCRFLSPETRLLRGWASLQPQSLQILQGSLCLMCRSLLRARLKTKPFSCLHSHASESAARCSSRGGRTHGGRVSMSILINGRGKGVGLVGCLNKTQNISQWKLATAHKAVRCTALGR